MRFEDIITRADQYEVAKARASLAVSGQWAERDMPQLLRRG